MIQRGVTFRASKIPSPAVRTGTGLGENSLDYVIIFQCPALRIRPERRISHECILKSILIKSEPPPLLYIDYVISVFMIR